MTPACAALNKNPAFYALLAVDAAYMGVCCAKELVAALEAICGLAGTAGDGPIDAVRQLARIGREAACARSAAAEHLGMLSEVHAEADGMFRALDETAPREDAGASELAARPRSTYPQAPRMVVAAPACIEGRKA
jgi:hypothetical protein